MKEKIKTLDKNNEKLKLNKIARKQKLQERGITLIALVVTIIILLILAGVTLNIALSDNGLFGKAKKAAEEYKQAQSEEEDLISQFATQMYSEYVGATVEGYNLEDNQNKSVIINGTTSGVNNSDKKDSIGNDTIVDENGNQTFTTEENMKWRVWDFDGNTLRIIGNPTSQKLTLKGSVGYNNGVWALDHICKELYSNNKQGVTVTNLKRTDIQKVSTYDYTKYKHGSDSHEEDLTTGDENSIYFGATKKYDISNKYPKMWEENDKDWTYEYESGTTTGGDKECKTWEVMGTEYGQMSDEYRQGNANTTFKQSYYKHIYQRNELINDEYYDLIFKEFNEEMSCKYWLAGRSVLLLRDKCGFGVHYINYCEIGGFIGSPSVYESDRDRDGLLVFFTSYSLY